MVTSVFECSFCFREMETVRNHFLYRDISVSNPFDGFRKIVYGAKDCSHGNFLWTECIEIKRNIPVNVSDHCDSSTAFDKEWDEFGSVWTASCFEYVVGHVSPCERPDFFR